MPQPFAGTVSQRPVNVTPIGRFCEWIGQFKRPLEILRGQRGLAFIQQ